MLAQVQAEIAARDLGVEREAVAEAVLPIDLETEEADVELHRLVDREDP